MKRALVILVCSLLIVPLFSQIQYTARFTRLMNLCEIEIENPEEGWYKAIPRADGDQNIYDLLLKSEVEDMEIRYYLIPAHLDNHVIPPQIAFTTFVSNLASNQEQNYMFIRSIPETQVSEHYGAEWAGIATFVPRESVSDKLKGKILCLYHADKARAYVMIFYNQNYQVAEQKLRTIRFSNKT